MRLYIQDNPEVVTVGYNDPYSLPAQLVTMLGYPPENSYLAYKDGMYQWIPIPKTFKDYHNAIENTI